MLQAVNVRRWLAAALAAAWLTLGFLSDSVPGYSEPIWVLLCGVAAGSALALARWSTRYALLRYTLIAGFIGASRSAFYATEGIWGPAVVWAILLLTTVAAAVAIVAQSEEP